ncbi:hypothetical protein BJ742DRAFT_818144 [Cladochytrium replicatum]|nr:hypothetical protein BJ742DRAFT_818144 [Cladochytrium replicatum]
MHVAAATSSPLNVKAIMMLNVAANVSSDPIIRPAIPKSPLADNPRRGAVDDDSYRGRTLPKDTRPQQMNYLPSATFPIALSERSSRPASRITPAKSQQSSTIASRRAVPFAATILPLELSLNPHIAPKSRPSPPQIWVTDEQGCVLVRRATFAPPPCSCPCTCQEEEEERKTAPNLDDDPSFPNISVDIEPVKPHHTVEDDQSALLSSDDDFPTRTDSPVQLRLDLRRHRSLDRLDSTHSKLCIPTDDPLHASSLDHLDHLSLPRDSSPDPLSPLPRSFRIPHPFSSPQCPHHAPNCVFNPTPPAPTPKRNLQDFIRRRLERSPPRGSHIRLERQRSPPRDKSDRNPFAQSERERSPPRDQRASDREERTSKWSFTNPSSPRLYTERLPPATTAPIYADTDTTERQSRWSRIPASARTSEKSTPPPYSAPAADKSYFDDDEIPIVTLGSRKQHGASMPPALGRRDTVSSDDTQTNDPKIDYLHPHRIPRYIITKVRLSQQAKEAKKSAAKDKERERRGRERERSSKDGEKGTTTSAAGIRNGFVAV